MATGGRNGGKKTGGRKAGTPNKATVSFRESLLELDFDVAKEAVTLYRSYTLPPNLQVQLLEMIASYAYYKPKPIDTPPNPLENVPQMSDEEAIKALSAGDEEADE